MKTRLTAIFVAIILAFSACNQCGPDVFLGEYKVLEESKGDWYPYVGVGIVTFENMDGVAIELAEDNRREEMLEQRYRDICKGRNIEDVTREKYTSERIIVEYSFVKDNITYFLTATIYVDRFAKDNAPALAVYDRVYYTSRVQNFNDANEVILEGDIALVANTRGTAIENSDLWYDTVAHFAEEVTINGKTYQDIWYFEDDGLVTLYVQEGIGILAFAGFNGEVWVRK